MRQLESGGDHVLLVTGLGADRYDPVTRAALRLVARDDHTQIHIPTLNDNVEGADGYVAVPSLSVQASRVRDKLRDVGPARVVRIVTHSLGALVAAYADLNLDGIGVTAIAPGLTSAKDRVTQACVPTSEMSNSERSTIQRYEEEGGDTAFGLMRRPSLSPVIISHDFMDEISATDPLPAIISLLQQAQTQGGSRVILIENDGRLGNQPEETAVLRELVPGIQVDTYDKTSDHYLFNPKHAATVVGAAVLGAEVAGY